MEGLEHLENDYELAQFLQSTLVAFATQDGGGGTPEHYAHLRKYFLDNSATSRLVPDWVRTHRTQAEFWGFIKFKFRTYAERRAFIWNEMSPLLEFCESNKCFPAEKFITKVMQRFDADAVTTAWQKALERKSTDPEGAITLSRTILESVCRHILDERGIKYDESKTELSDLYKKTQNALNLSPSQHTEVVFKQILGGCAGVVNGLGQLRNKLGDAHGKGKKPVKPAARHAELAVNLAGSMALFLIETHRMQSTQ